MRHPRKIYIVLDALDECTVRGKLINWVNSIVSNPDFYHVQLLATSRPEEEFQRSIPIWIGEKSCIRFNKESVTADIRSYVKDRLETSLEFKKWSSFPSVLRRIEEEVGDKADGMYSHRPASFLASKFSLTTHPGSDGQLASLIPLKRVWTVKELKMHSKPCPEI
ncbi:hypothetical protein Ct61P_12177 [Colletotrichum tofieldiae]|nr:hypothetical protein Ct61P_12177 [Colletotrichum tofieldiae]